MLEEKGCFRGKSSSSAGIGLSLFMEEIQAGGEWILLEILCFIIWEGVKAGFATSTII